MICFMIGEIFKVVNIKPILSSKIVTHSKKSLKPRKIPNSVSTHDEVFQKGGGSQIKFYDVDLSKMALMSFEECEKYKEYLISTGKFYETTADISTSDLPEWIKQAISKP